MRLADITATAHPDGHRIDLTWANPDPATFPGMRVVRREDRYPTIPDDGLVVADGTSLAFETDAKGRALYRLTDSGIKGETVYYYSLFPYSSNPPNFQIDRANRAAAMASSVPDMAGQMLKLLPAIYHRYDAEQEQLRRFLNLPGGQLDLLHSFARALLHLYNLDRVDGRLLPLLAQWIGWKTDFRLEIDAQRNEIRNAPAVFQRVGLIPVVGATVKRISGWESRSKEFFHNVFRSNQPERLNLWGRRMAADGTLVTADKLRSLDFAYEGRPSLAQDDHGIRWLFYHTQRRGRWRLWYKTSPTFRLGPEVRPHLETSDVAALQRAFAAAGVALAADATVTAAGSFWHVDDPTNAQTYVVEAGSNALTVYHTSADPLSMAPSRPLAAEEGVYEKYPTAVLQTDTLWVFWSVYDLEAGRWELRYRIRRDGTWSDTENRLWESPSNPVPERKTPTALVAQDGGLWLFWLERVDTQWLLRYNRHDGTGLDADPTSGWQLDPPATFPFDAADDPRVEGDVFALLNSGDAGRPIWIFWARKETLTTNPAQTRWTIAYRFKATADPALADWSAVETLPKDDEDTHDREPAALAADDGTLNVFWSANREGSWSIWRATLDPNNATPWETAEELTSPPYSQRDPLPLPVDGDTILFYRSNESRTYPSSVYRAAQTVDFRYAGSTTVHARNRHKIGLREAFEDFQTYTHDNGKAGERTNDDWYARDTLGIYLAPDTLNPQRVQRGIARLEKVLPEFMPTTDRAVFIPRSDLHTDYVYTYGLHGAAEPGFIVESYADTLTSAPEDPVPEPDED